MNLNLSCAFSLQGETYSFKDAIVLGEYKTDDSAVPNDKKGEKVTITLPPPKKIKIQKNPVLELKGGEVMNQ